MTRNAEEEDKGGEGGGGGRGGEARGDQGPPRILKEEDPAGGEGAGNCCLEWGAKKRTTREC